MQKTCIAAQECSQLSDAYLCQCMKAKGVRVTAQRIGIYRYLLENPCHPCADTIYMALAPKNATLSRTTVYNTLEALCRAGLVMPVTISQSETHYDANVTPHGHFRCEKCGDVSDMNFPSEFFTAGDGSARIVKRIDVYASGLCASCANER